MNRPDFALEQALGGVVAGVDESGRGPLAGPVIAAAVIIPDYLAIQLVDSGLDDSKRLSSLKRQFLATIIRGAACWAIGAASVAEIDRINILQASLRAMQRAVASLSTPPDHVLIDGPYAPPLPYPTQAIIGGDRRCLSIAAASVAAKVFRDHLMTRLAQRYPLYGWRHNRGYPTLTHKDSMRCFGITPHHRRSFAPVALMMSNFRR